VAGISRWRSFKCEKILSGKRVRKGDISCEPIFNNNILY
jgi:hypothetical protein